MWESMDMMSMLVVTRLATLLLVGVCMEECKGKLWVHLKEFNGRNFQVPTIARKLSHLVLAYPYISTI